MTLILLFVDKLIEIGYSLFKIADIFQVRLLLDIDLRLPFNEHNLLLVLEKGVLLSNDLILLGFDGCIKLRDNLGMFLFYLPALGFIVTLNLESFGLLLLFQNADLLIPLHL